MLVGMGLYSTDTLGTGGLIKEKREDFAVNEVLAVSEIVQGGSVESAIRALPYRMRKFFVQSFQSYIFNKTITLAVQAGEDMVLLKMYD